MRNILLFESFNLLNESISSARKRFVDTGKIEPEYFDLAVDSDPTSTKKYLEKMLDFIYAGAEPSDVFDDIEKFDNLVSKGIIKNKDINAYKTYQELIDVIDNTKNIKTKTEVKKDVEKVYEDETYLVVSPNTYEASCSYATSAMWCTADPETSSHWRKYRSRATKLYYIIDKTKTEEQDKRTDDPDRDQTFKIAVAVHSNGEKQGFLADDDDIEFEEVLEITGLDEKLFKPFDKNQQIQILIEEGTLVDNKNGTYNFKGDIDISNDEDLISLEDVLPFKIRILEGEFNCSDCVNLKSLKGSPETVHGEFNCSGCESLTSFKGGPKSVDYNFSANYCINLTSLEGSPLYVGWGLDIEYCDKLPQEEIDNLAKRVNYNITH